MDTPSEYHRAIIGDESSTIETGVLHLNNQGISLLLLKRTAVGAAVLAFNRNCKETLRILWILRVYHLDNMTSPSPLLYNTYYHIYNRGVNGENIFVEERNYDLFLRLYEKHLSAVTDLFAYCMLRNHFHISVRVKSEEEIYETLKISASHLRHDRVQSLSKKQIGQSRRPLGSDGLGSRYVSDKFSNFFNAYAKTINKAYGRTGSLFEHPFERVPITSDRQFWNVIAYIHQNPQKHGFVKDFRDWKYSSYGMILTRQPTIVKRENVMKWFGTRKDYLSLHKQWVTEAEAKWFMESDFD